MNKPKLADHKDPLANMSESEKTEWWAKAKKKIEADRRWHEEVYGPWARAHGWKDKRRGVCKLCGSQVRPDQRWHREGEVRIGGPSNGRYTTTGFYCSSPECGIMYKTCPPPITEEYDVPPPVREPDDE